MTSGEAEPARRAIPGSRIRLALLVSTLALPADLLVAYARARIIGSFPGEYGMFGPAGAAILHGQLASVYADPANQAGPLELLPYGVAHVLGVGGTAGWTVFYVVVCFLACLALTSVILLPVASPRGRWVLYPALGVTLLAVLGSFLPRAVFLGHPADFVIPLLWIAAALFALDRRFVSCAVLIALATGFEVWGILGVPVVLLAPSPRLVRAGLAGLVVLAALYLPFVLTGSFRMFGFHWTVDPATLYGLFWPGLSAFPWSLRVAQSVFALAAGVAAALLLRRNRFGPWAVPFSIVAARLIVDPLLLWYYWFAPASIALAALAVAIHWRAWTIAIGALGVIILLWFAESIQPVAAIILAIAALGLVFARNRLPTPAFVESR
ncbi:MAG TPA: hypothetical protein VGF80_04490 [Galbitalea sp.]